METKHTPGPWTVTRTITGRDYAVEYCGENSDGQKKFNTFVESPEYVICGVGGIGRDGCLANATLIAAAPELLEACKSLVEFWRNGTPVHYGSDAATDVIAAIAKAEGREQ